MGILNDDIQDTYRKVYTFISGKSIEYLNSEKHKRWFNSNLAQKWFNSDFGYRWFNSDNGQNWLTNFIKTKNNIKDSKLLLSIINRI
jgi:hypothetical protein